MDEVAETVSTSCAEMLGRERGGSDAERMDPHAPERLVPKERHDQRRPTRPYAGRSRARTAVVHDCRDTREEPLVGRALQDQDVVGPGLAGRDADPVATIPRRP